MPASLSSFSSPRPASPHPSPRYYVRDAAESQVSAVEQFLNSVPILSPLSREEKLRLVDAFEQRTYTPGTEVRAARCPSMRPQQHRFEAPPGGRHECLAGAWAPELCCFFQLQSTPLAGSGALVRPSPVRPHAGA